MTCLQRVFAMIPPINLLLTLKRSAIVWCEVPFLCIVRILRISDSVSFALKCWLPMHEKRTLLLCNSFSLRVQYSRLESLLSVLIPFIWFVSWCAGRGPMNARSTKEWTDTVRGLPTRLTVRYPPRTATCGLNSLLGNTRPISDIVSFLRTFPRLLTAYLPRYPGMSFQTSCIE